MSGFFVYFDDESCVEFIELFKSSQFAPIYKGVNILNLPARAAITLVEKDDSYDKFDPELGYSYVFKVLQMSFWRRNIIAERQKDDDGVVADGIMTASAMADILKHSDVQLHDIPGVTFESVGIAVNGYF